MWICGIIPFLTHLIIRKDIVEQLKGSQRKYLRGLAHKLNPAAFVGQKGLTSTLVEEIDQALDASELIKVKFNDFKNKEQKTAISDDIAAQLNCHIAGMIGHVVILYRRHKDPDKRRIKV